MNIMIRGKNVEITDALRSYVIRRVSKLERYSDDFIDVQVTLLVERGRHRVEVTAPLHGIILRGEEESGDMYASIDQVLDKLERQIEKYRSRIDKRIRPKAMKEREAGLPVVEEVLEEQEVVRVKKFPAKPMSVDEALMQMNLIGHNFYVFRNDKTQEMNVVYKRKYGDYGLLEPE
jgi:putative sigma-54 modulation protein